MNQTRFERPESPTRPERITPLALLDEFERRGITARAQGQRLEFDTPLGVIPFDLRAALVEYRSAVLALLHLRQYAETRRRYIHWFCPDATLFRLWREAERVTGQNLTFAGRLSVKPRKKITCRNSAPQDSLI